MAYDTTIGKQKLLVDCLVKQFNEDEMREFLGEAIGDAAYSELPSKSANLKQFAKEAVDYMVRHNLVNPELFIRWRETRPRWDSELSALENGMSQRGDVWSTKDLPPSIERVGDSDQLKIVCKVKGSGFVKSTKAIEVPGGCVVQVSTKEGNPDGSYAIAEAMSFVPGVSLKANEDGRSWRFVQNDRSE